MVLKTKEEKKKALTDRQKATEVAINQIKERFGDGSIMRLKEAKKMEVDSISTGCFSLDLALGIGGVPKGRIVEIFGKEMSGKSTLALHVIAQSQKRGGVAAFVDAEHALDPEYAKRIGVNINDLLISQPDSGEQALEIVETLVRSNGVDVIVVDSVAALTPKKEIEGDMGDSHVGLQARLMSQALRKLTSIVSRTNTSVIFINQIRMKIGVFFGCFSWDSLVTLADGSKKRIGTIVNQKLPLNVLSYNFKKKNIESQRIVDWHVNGETDAFLQFSIQNHTGNGCRGFSCTPDHKIYTSKGWKKAKELRKGDRIFVRVKEERPTLAQEQLLFGSILGDGNLKKGGEQTAYFREEHGPKQKDYIKWLGKELGNLLSNIRLHTKRGNALVESRHLLYFGDLLNMFYPKDKKIVPEEIIEQIGPRAIAAWYCGDGSLQTGTSWWKGKSYKRRPIATLYTNGFRDKASQQRIVRIFHRFGLKPTLRKMQDTRAVQFSVSDSVKFFELVAPHIPPIMWYKLPTSYHKHYKKLPSQKTQTYYGLRLMKIKKIKERVPYRDGRRISRRRFDISVSRNHNYFVDNCLVSNSPETTTGGLALKFYSSVRIELKRLAQIKKGEEVIGNKVKAKIAKNKVAPPFKTCEFEIMYNQGISWEGDLLNLGAKYGLVKKSGNTLSYEKTKLGVGWEKSKQALRDNPKLAKELERKILQAIKE